MQWLNFQMGTVGPYFGQVGYFHKWAGSEIDDKRPLNYYVAKSCEALQVMEDHLTGREWFLGQDYTIADITMLGWVQNMLTRYDARELLGFDDFPQVLDWLDRGLARPAVERAYQIMDA